MIDQQFEPALACLEVRLVHAAAGRFLFPDQRDVMLDALYALRRQHWVPSDFATVSRPGGQESPNAKLTWPAVRPHLEGACLVIAEQLDLERECGHQRARLVRDVTAAGGIGPWYVQCADCWSAGPTADTDTDAVAQWTEIVEVLDVWNSGAALVSEMRAPALAADEAAFAGKTVDAWLP